MNRPKWLRYRVRDVGVNTHYSVLQGHDLRQEANAKGCLQRRGRCLFCTPPLPPVPGSLRHRSRELPLKSVLVQLFNAYNR